ncbi:MAG: T5orf172 domain-containing protein [Satyrvirus sp.]|uniref:T5orf172 domain-containing protein n=1 Tax=Satyrvirus sp. TaxID=2487771 RepID=A0A3G5ADS8_9VIRU|nr:MAG: T5orf172 domain-containing protein [Satyrvirus sp.]
MIKTEKQKNKKDENLIIYLISSQQRIKQSEYKIGCYTGNINGLISRYRTYLIKPILLFYCVVKTDPKKIEYKILQKFNTKRLPYESGRFSEWVKMDFNILKESTMKIINSCESVNKTEYISYRELNNEEKTNEKIIKELLNVSNLDTIKDPIIKHLVENEKKINKCMRSIMLYYKDIDMYYYNHKINTYVHHCLEIKKNKKRLLMIIKIIKWLEKFLNTKRFEIVDMKEKDTEKIKKEMLKELNLFQWLSLRTTEIKRKEEIIARIEKINSQDRLKKFYIDIINNFDNLYSYQNKRKTKKRITVYYNFTINEEKIEKHWKIINYLKLDLNDLNNPL